MKKTIFLLAAGLIAMAGTTTYAASAKSLTGTTASVNEKAIKNQVQAYGEDVNTTWFDAQNGYIAHFTKDDKQATSAYDEKGNWVYTIFRYTEDKMDDAVKERVKSVYYMDDITGVEQVEQPSGNTVYLVHLENKNELKTVRLDDEDMQLMQEYKKG